MLGPERLTPTAGRFRLRCSPWIDGSPKLLDEKVTGLSIRKTRNPLTDHEKGDVESSEQRGGFGRGK